MMPFPGSLAALRQVRYVANVRQVPQVSPTSTEELRGRAPRRSLALRLILMSTIPGSLATHTVWLGFPT